MTANDAATEPDSLLNPGPSVAECLTRYGVPLHMHGPARSAFTEWLHTWQGLHMTAEDLSQEV